MDSSSVSQGVEVFLGKISIPVQQIMVSSVVGFASNIGKLLSMGSTDIYNLEMAVEEALANAVCHYSAPAGSDEQIHVEFTVECGELVVSVREKGSPYDFSPEGQYSAESLDQMELPGLGTLLMSKAMDRVEFIRHGREGKETRLTKVLALDCVPPELFGARPVTRATARITVTEPVIRMAGLEDAAQISRLAWRCYGYTQMDLLYDPDAMRKRMEQHELLSVVALDPQSDTMIGHIGLKYSDALTTVPELGMAFLDPGFRCPRLMQKMSALLLALSRQAGNRGIYASAVTNHIYSQKDLAEYVGSRPCGIFLGFAPSGMQVKELRSHAQDKGSVVNHFLAFDRSAVPVHVPERHLSLVQEIYGWLELPREYVSAPVKAAEGKTLLLLPPLPPELNAVIIEVRAIGADAIAQIKAAYQQCRRERKDATYLFLPAADPGLPALVPACEEMGFFFSGIMPHIHDGGDRFILQRVDIELDYKKVALYGEQAQRLMSYILSEKSRMEGVMC